MGEWKKICCAIDFSEPSRLAMEEGARLALRCQAELTLLHVHEVPTVASTETLSPRKLLERALEEAERKLAGWKADAERIAGRPVRSMVLTGEAAPEILRSVREQPFDLLVVSTHGRTGLKRLVLGSVAERVVREADCPVLVARRVATWKV